jgi:Tol biopolymer transport system component
MQSAGAMSRACVALLAAVVLPACSIYLGEGDDPPIPDAGWSPDASPPVPDARVGPARYELVFVDNDFGLYVALGNTRGDRLRLAGTYELLTYLAVSPDGEHLAVNGFDRGLRLEVLSMVDGTTRRVGTGFLEGTPSWSPDGRELTYARRWGSEPFPSVVRASLDGSIFEVIAPGSSLDGTSCMGPVWSPDGREIAYAMDDEVRIHTVATGATRTVATRRGGACHPAWSPGGTALAFTVGRTGPSRLVVVGAGGGPARDLADLTAAAGSVGPAWAPDGRSLVFDDLDPEPGGTAVRRIALDGTPAVTLAAGSDPRWSPDGSAILYESARASIALWDVATGTSRDLYGAGLPAGNGFRGLWLATPIER